MDGIAAKLLRCGIASEVLRQNMPLRNGWPRSVGTGGPHGGRTAPQTRSDGVAIAVASSTAMGSIARDSFSRKRVPEEGKLLCNRWLRSKNVTPRTLSS